MAVRLTSRGNGKWDAPLLLCTPARRLIRSTSNSGQKILNIMVKIVCFSWTTMQLQGSICHQTESCYNLCVNDPVIPQFHMFDQIPIHNTWKFGGKVIAPPTGNGNQVFCDNKSECVLHGGNRMSHWTLSHDVQNTWRFGSVSKSGCRAVAGTRPKALVLILMSSLVEAGANLNQLLY